ncbi:hypothetical protein [Sphingomonas oryzagri]
MSNSNVTTTNPVNKLALSFRSTITSYVDTQREFEVQGHRVVYQMIAEAFMVAQNIRKETLDIQTKAFAEHGFTVSKSKTANPYGPIVKLLFGEWKTVSGSQKFTSEQPAGQKTLFEPNRSAEKYACVFRYFDKRKDQFRSVADIVKHIEDTKGALRTIEDQDRKDHPSAKSKATAATDDLAWGKRTIGSVEIDRPDFVPQDADYGVLWFVKKDEEICLMGFKSMTADAFEASAKARGKLMRSAAIQQLDEEVTELAA